MSPSLGMVLCLCQSYLHLRASKLQGLVSVGLLWLKEGRPRRTFQLQNLWIREGPLQPHFRSNCSSPRCFFPPDPRPSPPGQSPGKLLCADFHLGVWQWNRRRTDSSVASLLSLVHSQPMLSPRCSKNTAFPQKVKIELPYGPAITLLAIPTKALRAGSGEAVCALHSPWHCAQLPGGDSHRSMLG